MSLMREGHDEQVVQAEKKKKKKKQWGVNLTAYS